MDGDCVICGEHFVLCIYIRICHIGIFLGLIDSYIQVLFHSGIVVLEFINHRSSCILSKPPVFLA